MRILLLVVCLCGVAEAQSIVISGDGRSIVISGAAQVPQAPVVKPIKQPAPVPHKPSDADVSWDWENAISTDLPEKPAPITRAMTHSEMVALHNSLHGPGSWTWPGDLGKHLEEFHKVSTAVSVSKPVVLKQSTNNCPNGVCPTRPQYQMRTSNRRRRSR